MTTMNKSSQEEAREGIDLRKLPEKENSMTREDRLRETAK